MLDFMAGDTDSFIIGFEMFTQDPYPDLFAAVLPRYAIPGAIEADKAIPGDFSSLPPVFFTDRRQGKRQQRFFRQRQKRNLSSGPMYFAVHMLAP